MALARTLRESVLRHARFAVPAAALAGTGAVASSSSAAAAGGGFFARAFAAASTYLDKDQVTQRVLGVVKNFDKVDPAKVRREALMVWGGRAACFLRRISLRQRSLFLCVAWRSSQHWPPSALSARHADISRRPPRWGVEAASGADGRGIVRETRREAPPSLPQPPTTPPSPSSAPLLGRAVPIGRGSLHT
jgi:hypothetical protein